VNNPQLVKDESREQECITLDLTAIEDTPEALDAYDLSIQSFETDTFETDN
jgi:hypothetical protein